MMMAAKLRRLLAALLLAVSVSPAFAIIPLGFGVGIVTGMASSGLTLPTILSAVGVGSLIAYVSLHNDFSSPTVSGQTISVMLNPKTEMPKRPDTYSAAPAGQAQPTPPTQSPGPHNFYRAGGSALPWTDKATACSREGPYHYCEGYSYQPYGACCRDTDGGNIGPLEQTTEYGCDLGWTSNGSGSCIPMAKPSDDHCTILRNGNSFTSDPLDPDCALVPTSGNVTISGDASSITATRDDGSKVEVRLQADGTAVVIDTRQTADGMNTQRSTYSMSAPNPTTGAVTVTGKKSETITGVGDLEGGGGSGTSTVTFDKSGLATEGTSNAIKGVLDNINTKLGAVSGDVTGSPSTMTGSREWTAELDKAKDGSMFGGIIGTLLTGWGFASILPSASCTPSSSTVAGVSITLNYCSAVDSIRQILGWIFYVVTSFVVFRIFTKVS